jgi:hypothetical protein
MTTTPAITFFLSVVDTGQKNPKNLKNFADVNNTANKESADKTSLPRSENKK